jgi:hypothetical protein
MAPWAAAGVISSGGEPASYYVGTPSRTSFSAEVFRISRPIYYFLSAATEFSTLESLQARLAIAAGVDAARAARYSGR